MAGIDELRVKIEVERAAWPGTRWRCSKELRDEIVAVVTGALGDGARVSQVARSLTLTPGTLARWLSRREGGDGERGEFRPIEVAGPGRESAGGLTLVTPGGYRVEGLDLAAVEHLLGPVE